MSKQTRKRIWPVSLVMALAVIGMMAAIALSTSPGTAQAQGLCDTASGAVLQGLIDAGVCQDAGSGGGDAGLCDTATGDVLQGLIDAGVCRDTGTGDTTDPAKPVVSSSTSGSATVELKLSVKLTQAVPVGGAFVLYLEDDFQEPDSISASDVYFVSTPSRVTTGSGSRVYATQAPEIETDGHFTADKKDIDIRVSVPDMCTTDTPDCQGANGLRAGDTVTMVIQKSAGIMNPSEAGSHSTGYSILGPTDGVPSGPSGSGFMKTNELSTVAKITLSDVDNSRGYEMTVTGSGFNNGTTASVYVLAGKAAVWDTLDCDAMNAAAGSNDAEMMGFCRMYAALTDEQKAVVRGLDYTGGPAEAAACEGIRRNGTEVGSALVGSDDKVAVTFEVTAPTFQPGNVNYICMVDGEGRMSDTDVEDFKLEPSIKVVPSSVASGDTVNVFAQDYPANTGGFVELKISGESLYMTGRSSNPISLASIDGIRADGSGEVSFKVPGGLEGVLRIDAKWGSVNEDSKITITGGELSASKTEALPNETITITGNGFGSQTCIPAANITLDSVPVMVDAESISTSGGCKDTSGVEVSNSGQFVATIVLWQDSGTSNPTLIPGTHELSVEDSKGFGADVSITIPEPTVRVSPDVAGPRDYVTITGENWPVDNPEGASTPSIRAGCGRWSITPLHPVR